MISRQVVLETQLNAQFDILALHFELLESRAVVQPDPGDHVSCGAARQTKPDGMRIVLQTSRRISLGVLLRDVGKALSPISDFELCPLFEGADEEPCKRGVPDLATFWLLQLPIASKDNRGCSHFDLAYYLRDCLDLASAEPDLPFENFESPSDIVEDLHRTGPVDRAWHLRKMNVKQAWDYSGQRGAGICIGHPDTGYVDHIDLDPARIRTKSGFDFVDMKSDPFDTVDATGSVAHGTATGSVIMSGGTIVSPPISGEGGTGAPGAVTGLVPEAELIPVRAASNTRLIYSSRLAQAIYHCRKSGCGVIAICIGGYPSKALKNAISDALLHQMIVVAAAGNRVGASDDLVWPASYHDCIAVAASDADDRPASWNCNGPRVDVAAPGQGVWRAIGGATGSCTLSAGPGSGTSYAASNAAGAAALWLGHHGRDKLIRLAKKTGITVQSLFRQALWNSSRCPDDWDTKRYGCGIIDLHRLLRVKLQPTDDIRDCQAATRRHSDDCLPRALGTPNKRMLASVLSQLLGTEQGTGSELPKWEQELIAIVQQLQSEGNPALEKVKADPLLDVEDRADIVSAIIRPHASGALAAKLARGNNNRVKSDT